MAQVDTNNPNDPTNPNNQPNQVSQPGQVNQPTTSGGAGAVTTTGAGNVTGQVVGTNNPAQPFQNISSYLKANEQGGKDLAGQVAGTVSAPINEAQTGITNAANSFTGSVNAGYAPRNQDLIKAVSENPSYVVDENPENVANFKAQLGNKYTGPTDFTQMPGYSDLQTKIAQAQGAAANTQNEAGIQSLLQGVEGPTTAGINKLDSLLLSANPENYKTIGDAGAPAANLLPTLQSTTAAQNALASTGATEASSSAADAAAALQAALKGERGNLSEQQNVIQGIIDEYNKSVGIINPVTSNISADIQNFLKANPSIKPADAAAALQPLMNLSAINTPDMSTYASPYDYKTVSALQALGLSPEDLASLGIKPDQSNLAQTFKVPDALQNAVGQAPGVEQQLQQLITGLGGQITGAYQPYQDLMSKEMTRSDLRTQLDQTGTQLRQAQNTLARAQANPVFGPDGSPDEAATKANVAKAQAGLDAIIAQQKDIMAKATSAGVSDRLYGSYWDDIGQMAQGLQWLDPASTGYNELVKQINAELGKLGDVGVPTLNYHPTTLTDPVTGVPIGELAAQDIGKAANLAALGATGASAIGSGLLAAGAGDIASGALPMASQLSATPGEAIGAGVQGGLQTLGPAAVAAYGASNIAQNSAAHPLEAGVSTLANMGLSLATLSLPPQIFESIGPAIKNIIHDIGNWFGGLF